MRIDLLDPATWINLGLFAIAFAVGFVFGLFQQQDTEESDAEPN